MQAQTPAAVAEQNKERHADESEAIQASPQHDEIVPPAEAPGFVGTKGLKTATGMSEEAVPVGVKKLVVYDFDASDQYKPVALILTEALREELFLLNRFTLVNRENLGEVLKEMTLQQTGLLDEKEAVKTGKGMAANEVIVGKVSQLGKNYVLQAKRVDVETLATLGIASAKFAQGQENDVMSQMPHLAKSLAGMN